LPKLSVREKILLYLGKTASKAALASTQVGIANATGLHRTHVSRMLEALAREGLVARERVRVPGFGRTMLVFALSDSGRRAYADLERNLGDLVVEVPVPDAPARRERLGDLLRRAGPDRQMWDVVRTLEADEPGTGFDVPSAAVQAFVRDLEDAPVVAGFVGRASERRQLAEWMGEPAPSCLVEGAGGIGKSILVAHVLQDAAPRRHVLWVRLSPNMSPAKFLARLAGFLLRVGRPLPSSTSERAHDLVEQLPARLRNLPLLFVFDDVHKADDSLRQAFEGLATAAQRPGGLKVVWIGRTLRLPVEAMRRALRIDLTPLSADERRELLSVRGVPETKRARLAERSGGNPLFLELLAAGGSEAAAQEGLVRYLREGVWEASSSGEMEIVKHLSAVRGPVSRTLLEATVRFEPVALERLVGSRIVTGVGGGALEMHDEIRDAVYGQLAEAERRAIHDRWAAAFDPQAGSMDSLVEYIHHLRMAGRRSEAAWWAIRNQTALLLWARNKFRAPGAPRV